MFTAAFRAYARHFLCYHNFPAFIAIVSRNPMSPPKLAADAPVSDVVRPVKICLLHPFGNQLDFPVLYCLHCRFDEFIHLYKPLLFNQWLNGCLAAVMGAYIVGIVLYLH